MSLEFRLRELSSATVAFALLRASSVTNPVQALGTALRSRPVGSPGVRVEMAAVGCVRPTSPCFFGESLPAQGIHGEKKTGEYIDL